MIVAAYPASMWMSLAMDSTWMLDKQNLLGGFGYPLIMCLTCSGSVMCMFITLSRFPIATRNRSNWELLLAHTWLLSHVVPVVIKIVWFDKSFPAFFSCHFSNQLEENEFKEKLHREPGFEWWIFRGVLAIYRSCINNSTWIQCRNRNWAFVWLLMLS